MITCSLRKLKSFSAALSPLRRQVYPNTKAEDGGRGIVAVLSRASSSSFSTYTDTSGQLFPWRHDSKPPDRVSCQPLQYDMLASCIYVDSSHIISTYVPYLEGTSTR